MSIDASEIASAVGGALTTVWLESGLAEDLLDDQQWVGLQTQLERRVLRIVKAAMRPRRRHADEVVVVSRMVHVDMPVDVAASDLGGLA